MYEYWSINDDYMFFESYGVVNLNGKSYGRSRKDAGRWLVETTLDDGRSISQIYTDFGVNKLASNYSEDNVRNLVMR